MCKNNTCHIPFFPTCKMRKENATQIKIKQWVYVTVFTSYCACSHTISGKNVIKIYRISSYSFTYNIPWYKQAIVNILHKTFFFITWQYTYHTSLKQYLSDSN